MSKTTKELRELLAEASFAPWVHKQGKAAFDGWPVASFGSADDGDRHWVSVMGRRASEGPTRGADSDAKLVAAMRNVLPDLLAVVEAAEQLRHWRKHGLEMDYASRRDFAYAVEPLFAALRRLDE